MLLDGVIGCAHFNADLQVTGFSLKLQLVLYLAAVFRDARSQELYLSLCFHDTRNKRKFGASTVSYRVTFSVDDRGLWTVVKIAVRFLMSNQGNREL